MTLQPFLAPVSVSVKIAGYTIPEGRGARIIANLEGSATLTINGVLALRGTQNNVLGSTSWAWSGGTVGLAATGASAPSGGPVLATATDQKTVVETIHVPPGTVLNGTGTFRYIVEEYLV